MKAKFQAGCVFKLSKVKLDPKHNATYASTDIKQRIMLDTIQCSPVPQGSPAEQRLPQDAVPSKHIQDIQGFDGYTRFNIMGVLRFVSEARQRTAPFGQKHVI